jgi:hypothetical protein
MDREIQLTQGKVAIVDDIDYMAVLNLIPWYALKDYYRDTWYARKIIYINKKQIVIKMEYIVAERMGLILLPGEIYDHKDRNGLNIKRENIRKATYQLNRINSRKDLTASSKYRGVRKRGQFNYEAFINRNYKYEHLGNFIVEEYAARMYDIYAKMYFGEFAVLNFPKG